MHDILPDDVEVWRDLFEEANDLIQSVDKDGKFLYVNKKWRDLLGYSYKEARQMAFPDIIHPKHLQACLTAFGEMQQGKSFDNFTTQFVTKEGRIVDVEGNISVRVKDGKFVSTWGIFRDVTFRNQREQELDHIAKMLVRRDFELFQTNDILRIRDEQIAKEQELNRAKSEFVSLASHQLKTPLTTINWYAEMLLGEKVGSITEEQNKYLETIFHNGRRMVELVNALLNASRVELGTLAIEPKPLNFIEIADSVLDELLPRIKDKKLRIEKSYEKNLPIINADPQLSRIIFQNLLSNSVKYTPDNGIIDITIKTQELNILIQVSDNGCGIPETQQAQIFKKLFRADNAKGKDSDGTGLGLYIVKSVLDQSGGKIWFESKENKGTIFYVTIPLKGMEKKKGTKGLV